MGHTTTTAGHFPGKNSRGKHRAGTVTMSLNEKSWRPRVLFQARIIHGTGNRRTAVGVQRRDPGRPDRPRVDAGDPETRKAKLFDLGLSRWPCLGHSLMTWFLVTQPQMMGAWERASVDAMESTPRRALLTRRAETLPAGSHLSP